MNLSWPLVLNRPGCVIISLWGPWWSEFALTSLALDNIHSQSVGRVFDRFLAVFFGRFLNWKAFILE